MWNVEISQRTKSCLSTDVHTEYFWDTIEFEFDNSETAIAFAEVAMTSAKDVKVSITHNGTNIKEEEE